AGVTKVVATEALAAGDLVFQQAVKQGLKQTDALAMASKRIAEKLGTAGASAELVTALTNGLRPATRAKLAAGQVTRTVTGATGTVKPKPPAAVTPAPTRPAKPAAPAAGKPAPARPAKPAAPTKPAPVNPTKPIAGKPAPAAPTKPAPVNPAKPIAGKPAPATPGATPAAIRTLAGDVALLGTAAYEAGRATRRAADATFRAGQATRAFVDGGGVSRSWQAAWARHDQAYKAMHRELAETGEAASRWMKDLATRVISK
ncbi:MAG: hypothetical protein VKS61_02165, partial [Candidatus Sericytochromatia bacterium]|nr:hypothetical protein [Candidatus Sericytochromatia bacterium]